MTVRSSDLHVEIVELRPVGARPQCRIAEVAERRIEDESLTLPAELWRANSQGQRHTLRHRSPVAPLRIDGFSSCGLGNVDVRCFLPSRAAWRTIAARDGK